MVIARVDTGRFEFVALGEDEKHARLILRRAWRKHRSEYRYAEARMMDTMLADGEVTFIPVPGPGVALRDSEILIHHTH